MTRESEKDTVGKVLDSYKGVFALPQGDCIYCFLLDYKHNMYL